MEPSNTTGRKGSLANPEVREDVPGHVIPIIRREFDDFDNEAEKYLAGGTPENEFIGFRLKQGVYGQRQPDVQMIRTKLPWGGISPEQMEAFASAIERYAPLDKGHITTRQNIQVHHVPLPDAAAFIREISDAGLSSREGCGNTVRNVTADPWAGVCADELFDTTPYAGAFVRYFVRHPTTQLMPRKVKTAFTGSDTDRALTGIHDIAFLAREREGVKGFEVRVGGGTSIMPRVAPTLYEFVAADDGEYLKIAEAVFRIFDRQDWLRVNRARARLKVLVDKVGIDEVRRMVDEELEGDWVAERDFSIEDRVFLYDEQADAPGVPLSSGSPNGDGAAFARFREANVEPQRQQGFSTVQVKVTRGDLTPEQFRGLAAIMREYCGGHARTTVHQNFLLRWVRDEAVYDVWQRLGELGLGDAGADRVNDVVSCPGTDSCKLGITSSMGLNRAVQERIESMHITDPLTQRIHIKMSGCPNGCSQHHIGNIGLYGASIKVGEHTIPAYVAHIGGNYEGGEIVYGKRLKVRLASKRVPEAVERWIRFYEAGRYNESEVFNAFAERVGPSAFEDLVRDLAMPIEFGLETMETFIDWTKNVPFQVERGEGECAV
jgi:sulfite reductase (ferredoxin)